MVDGNVIRCHEYPPHPIQCHPTLSAYCVAVCPFIRRQLNHTALHLHNAESVNEGLRAQLQGTRGKMVGYSDLCVLFFYHMLWCDDDQLS